MGVAFGDCLQQLVYCPIVAKIIERPPIAPRHPTIRAVNTAEEITRWESSSLEILNKFVIAGMGLVS